MFLFISIFKVHIVLQLVRNVVDWIHSLEQVRIKPIRIEFHLALCSIEKNSVVARFSKVGGGRGGKCA